MKGDLEIQKYSRCSGEGLFADNVILSLLDYIEKGTLDNKGRDVFKRARDFLDDAIEGGNLQNSVFNSAHDVDVARAFYSLEKVNLPRSSNIIEYIRTLRSIINDVLNNKTVEDFDLKFLDRFFTIYGQVSYQKAKDVLEVV